MTAAELARELLPRLRRWSPDSWTVAAGPVAPAVPAAPAPAGSAGPDGAAGGPGGAAGGPGGAAGRALAAGVAGGTRADVAAAVVQRLADLGADAEGRPRRPVPRLDDVVLADQLAVLAEDVLRTGAPEAEAALAAELTALRGRLGLR